MGVHRSYSCFGPYPRWLSWGPCPRDSCARSTGVSQAVSYETSRQRVLRQSPWDCCLIKGSTGLAGRQNPSCTLCRPLSQHPHWYHSPHQEATKRGEEEKWPGWSGTEQHYTIHGQTERRAGGSLERRSREGAADTFRLWRGTPTRETPLINLLGPTACSSHLQPPPRTLLRHSSSSLPPPLPWSHRSKRHTTHSWLPSHWPVTSGPSVCNTGKPTPQLFSASKKTGVVAKLMPVSMIP